jgi:hypothetical protein
MLWVIGGKGTPPFFFCGHIGFEDEMNKPGIET